MRRVTLLILLSLSIFSYSTRYLVQGPGTSSWRTAVSGEVNITLSTSLNSWYSSNSATFVSGTDEIWLAGGTYVTDGTITLKNGVNLYGSFAGTETLVSERSKVSGGKSWEFTSPTVIDGNNANRQGIITLNSTPVTYIDGLTITKYNIVGAAANVTGVGALITTNWILQNSIVSYNTFTNSTDKQCRGAGVYIKGGQLLNSYIHHNEATKGTGTGNTYGGGIAFAYNSSPVTTVKGCTIESNVSTFTGGGMVNLDGTGGVIEDCIFQSNSCPAGNGGAIGTSASTGSGNGLTLKNNQFIENAAGGSGGAVYYYLSTAVATSIEGCSFIGNIATPTSNGGGGLCLDGGNFSPLKNCIFRDNKITNGYQGSALFVGPANTTVQNCVFANNTSAAANMHIVKVSNAGCKFLNCTFANNLTSGTGSAISFEGTVSTLTNCVFWNNYRFLNVATMVYRDVYGYSNTTSTYNATDGGDIWGISRIGDIKTLNSTANNTFVSPTTFQGAPADATQKAASAAADWSLMAGCPAINTGTDLAASGVTTDILGNTRPTGASAVDRGAYEAIFVTANQNISTYATNSDINISLGGHLTVDANKSVNKITLSPGAKLTLSTGNTLTATNGITLQSSTSGTATFVDNNNSSPQSVTGTVEQHLASARNWYLSSPIAGATIPAGQTYYSYDETGSNAGFVAPATLYWVAVPEGTTINPMKGYITQPGAATTKSYTGTFNTGTKTIALTRTNSASKPGFNLVANPYPSYLDWSMVDTTAANIQTSVWYRTKTSGGAYTFDTYNGKLDVATANGENTVSKLIPPMQAFWVRVKTGFAGGTLTFDNTMRKHADVSGNKMKAPKASETKVVRLQLSNGTNADEALVCFNSNAQNSFDSYDSPKMFESSATRPELYTLAGNEKVVINGLSDLNELSSDMELPLGFTTGAGGNFTLKATEIASFDNSRKLYLRDKQENRETELTPETEYAFSTTAATSDNESRFSLLFKAPGVTTGTTNANSERISVFVNTQNQITIIANPNSNYSIYNAVGQLIESGTLNSGLQITNCKLQTGVLVVKVNNQSTRVVVK